MSSWLVFGEEKKKKGDKVKENLQKDDAKSKLRLEFHKIHFYLHHLLASFNLWNLQFYPFYSVL